MVCFYQKADYESWCGYGTINFNFFILKYNYLDIQYNYMREIIERQTLVFSIDMNTLAVANQSQIQTAVNLRFAADELVLKSLAYTEVAGTPDADDMVQIWCNITNDGLLTAFPNNIGFLQQLDNHFTINNTFQTGNITFQFQQTANGAPFYYNPQAPIAAAGVSNTNGILSFTLEFLKHSK
jgi:hypothetical protein